MSEEIVKVHEAVSSTIFEQIESLIEKNLSAERNVDKGYAKLGLLLVEVSEKELWREEYQSFNTYLEQLTEKYHRGRTMLYKYFSAVREMKPYLTEEQMDKMGISKLDTLKRATKELGFPPNNEVMQVALDLATSASEVRKEIAKQHRLAPEEQSGTWYELDGFFATEDERLVLVSAFEAAWRQDPIVQKTVKQSIRVKEGLLRMAMNFLADTQHHEETPDGF